MALAETARRRCRRGLLLAPLVAAGCAFQQYEPKPLEPGRFAAAFAERRLDDPGLAAFLPACGLPQGPWPRAEWDRSGLECAALYYNPELARARAAIEVARAGEITAGRRPALGAKLDAEHHSDRAGGSPWTVGPSLDLTFESPGRRAARIEGAAARTDAAQVALEERIAAVRLHAAEALAGYAEADRRAALVQARAALLEHAQALLERRRALGYASSFEVAATASELQRARLDVTAAAADARGARDMLARRIGVPAAALEGVGLELARFSEAPAEPSADGDALQARALTGRGDIRLALKDYALAEAALKEAVAAQYPDVTLSPGYLFDQGDHVWTLALGLVLPTTAAKAGPIAEARARREAAARAVEAVQATIVADVHEAVAAESAARRAAGQAATLLAEVERQETATRRRFEAGEADRVELVRAQIATAEARLRRAERVAAAWRARLRLESAVSVGGAIDGRAS